MNKLLSNNNGAVDERSIIETKLLRNFDQRRRMKRCMSVHVGSRWYRAPEICLVERQYDQASDMWSFGCIVHELLRYLITEKP